MGDGHMFAGVGLGVCEPLALDVLNTVANGWGTVAVLGVDHRLLGVWFGGVWEGEAARVLEGGRAHAYANGSSRLSSLCTFFHSGVGSGPHGEERGMAMFKKCTQRGLASCGLELDCYIRWWWFSLEGCTG